MAHIESNAGANDIVLDEPPPAYESVAESQPPPAEPPPTYQSLFGDIQRTREESKGIVEFFKNLAILFFSTIGFLICISLFLSIPITCIIIGVEYIDECTIQPKIPIYLIVLGSFGILRNIICMVDTGRKRLNGADDENEGSNAKKTGCTGVTDIFLFTWFICGNIWVYGKYQPDYTGHNRELYCNKTLYLFAFWLNTSVYILIGTFCCCFCFVGCCVAIFSDDENE